MASLASRIGTLIPDGHFKNSLRYFVFRVMFTTVGTKRVMIGTKNDKLPAFVGRLLFTKESLGERENEGYLRHCQLDPGDVVINAGAYHGYFAIYAAKKVGPRGLVVCFEPEPNNLRLLRKNIALNNLTNVKIIPQGLWSSITQLPLVSMGSGSNLQPDSTWQKQLISVTTLDHAVTDLKLHDIKLLTMDVEGAEIEALKGAAETIRDNHSINLAIASYHKIDNIPTSAAVENILRQYGLHAFTDYPPHPTTYARHEHT